MVMGTAGLAISWMSACEVVGAPELIGDVLGWLATALFVCLLAIYAAKIFFHPRQVVQEFRHPVQINYFPAVSIGLLLLAIIWTPSFVGLARWMWRFGAGLQLLLTLVVLSSWINDSRYEVKHANPTWFIPVVGNIIVPAAGVRFAPVDVNWFFFTVGLIFWLILMTIVFYRLFFHEPLPIPLKPTICILIAPPAAGFLVYLMLTNVLDTFARMLFFCAAFLTLLCGLNTVRFVGLPFSISAWAYSFPLAAMTLATFEMNRRTGSSFYGQLAWALLALLTAVVSVLTVKTSMLVMALTSARPLPRPVHESRKS